MYLKRHDHGAVIDKIGTAAVDACVCGCWEGEREKRRGVEVSRVGVQYGRFHGEYSSTSFEEKGLDVFSQAMRVLDSVNSNILSISHKNTANS